MDRLTKYLIDHAEELIGNPIRPTERVLERADAPLYIWRKMGMTHQLLAEKNIEGDTPWNTIAPAAHLYPFDADELKAIKPFLNKFYIELKAALGTVGEDLWYLIKAEGRGDEWYLYRNNESFGSVNIMSAQEVEYAADADAALINLVHHLLKDFPNTCDLATCIVLPFGCRDKNVWEYAGKVTLLGGEETRDFRTGVVNNLEAGKPTVQVTPKW